MNYKKTLKHKRYVLKKSSWKLHRFYITEKFLKKDLWELLQQTIQKEQEERLI